jgi:hypothetical protein
VTPKSDEPEQGGGLSNDEKGNQRTYGGEWQVVTVGGTPD